MRAFISIITLCLTIQFSFSQEIKVMTYNIKCDYNPNVDNNWNSRKDGMLKLINHYSPEIMGVQEAVPSQMEFLDSALTEYDFIGVGRDDGKKKGEFSAIFYNKTRYKVIKENTFWLSETPNKVSVGWDAALERICTYGLFENLETNSKFWVFNTHFDHIGDEARKNAAALIIQKARELNSDLFPIFIMGDFNLTPETEPIQLLMQTYNDSKLHSLEPPYGPEGTFNNFSDSNISTRIDYIFVEKVKVFSHTHIDDRLQSGKWISDHLPVLIEAQL